LSEPNPQPRVDPEHPWPALLSFREDDQRYFGGREEEVEALYRRIAAGRLTLLFGLSGLGKSSLLRAGLFPRLRREHYFPVYIRLRYGRDLPPPVEQIKTEIVRQARESRVEAPQPRPGETLWEYFHREDADFWDERNYPCIPVLVFDQFEELFTKSREVAEGANEVIEELANLAEGASPDLLRESDRSLLRQAFDERYRLLIGIRSDYLAQLQSISDRVRAVFANRYELHRMSGVAALKSTLTAGGHLMGEEVARRVVRFVAGEKEGGDESSVQGLEVEPALLSLVCSELNATRLANGAPQITASMLSGSKDEILSRFYETSFADVGPALRELVEDKLVTRDGKARNFISEQTARETPDVSDEDLGKLVQRRLLRFEESGSSRRMELTHDLLTTVAAASRATREQRRQVEEAERAQAEAERQMADAERKLRRSRATAVLFLFLLGLAVAGPFIAAQWTATGARKVEADSAFRLALQQLSSEEPNQGLAYLARVIRLDQGNDAARTLLYQQLVTRSWPVPLRKFGPEGRIEQVLFSGDGARVVFRVGEIVEMWDVAKGQRIGTVDAGFEPHDLTLASDGWTVIPSVGSYGKGNLLALWHPRKGPMTYADVGKLPGAEACDHLRIYDVSVNGDELAVDCLGLMFVSLRGGQPASAKFWQWTKSRFGPDPRFVAAYAGADAVIDRQFPSREVIQPRPDSDDFVGGFSRDGKRILVGRGPSVDVWDLVNGTLLAAFHNQSPAHAAVFDPAGQSVMTRAEDDGIRVWQADDGAMKFDPIWHAGLREAAFSNDGSQILTFSDRVARWWRAEDGTSLGEPVAVASKMLAAHFDAGAEIVTVSSKNARVWQLPPVRLAPVLPGSVDSLLGLAGDRRTVIARADGTFSAFDAVSGERMWSVPAGASPVEAHPESSRILLIDGDNRISMHDVKTLRPLWRLPQGLLHASFSSDGTAVIGQTEKTLMLLAAATGAPLAPPIEQPFGSLRDSSDDASMLVFRSGDAIRVWDVRQRRAVLTIPDQERSPMAMSPDGRRLAALSRAAGLRVWQLADKSVQAAMIAEGEHLLRVVFSPDGKRLAVASENDVVLCDASTLQCSDEMLAHAGVMNIEFSHDGGRVLTATQDDVRVWDVHSKRPLSLPLPRGSSQPGLSSDGKFLFAANQGELYRVPLPSIEDDDAERLATLGEALAGVRVDHLGVTEPVESLKSLAELGEQCRNVESPACSIVKWLRTPAAKRTISPVSEISPAEYAKRDE